jgi:RNA polymerase sigma-70 factor (ECF subfamily)
MNSQDLPADAELLARIQAGCEASFTALFRRHRPAVFRFAYAMTGDAASADEIVQEVFLSLLRQPSAWRPDRGPLEAFLHGIARNWVRRRAERESRYVPALDAEEVEPAAGALDGLVSGERADLLRKAVLSLPELYREALVLCDLEELSYEEASRRIGCPVGTVRSRLSRARALVASKLKSQIGCAS